MFKVYKTDKNVATIEFKIKSFKNWEQWVLLRSDVHHDNIHCRRDLEYQHLKEALEKNAPVIDNGDLFCAMQGKYDRRSSKESLRVEHQNNNYLDSLVDTTCNDYAKYAKIFAILGKGNHETAIEKNHETNLTQRLADSMRVQHDSPVQAMGYTNWINFKFHKNSRRFTRRLWMTHGYGGGGPVSQDVIQAARQREYIEGADIMMSGHVHRSWTQEYVKQFVNNAGKVIRRIIWYIKTPTYKDSYGVGEGGFEVEKGMAPRPLGAYWLRFYFKNEELQYQVIKAD